MISCILFLSQNLFKPFCPELLESQMCHKRKNKGDLKNATLIIEENGAGSIDIVNFVIAFGNDICICQLLYMRIALLVWIVL